MYPEFKVGVHGRENAGKRIGLQGLFVATGGG